MCVENLGATSYLFRRSKSLFSPMIAGPTRMTFVLCLVKPPLPPTAQAQVDTLSTTINSVRSANSLQLVPLGSNLTLQCQFGGVPIPSTVTWTVDGNTTTMESVRIAANMSTLEVTDFQRTGIYQCHVTNLYGTASGGVTLCGTGGCQEWTFGVNLALFKTCNFDTVSPPPPPPPSSPTSHPPPTHAH